MVRPYTLHLFIAGLHGVGRGQHRRHRVADGPGRQQGYRPRRRSACPIGAAILAVFAAKSISVFTQEVVINYVVKRSSRTRKIACSPISSAMTWRFSKAATAAG